MTPYELAAIDTPSETQSFLYQTGEGNHATSNALKATLEDSRGVARALRGETL